MEDVTDDLIQLCERALAEKGRLYTAIPGFVARPQQNDLAIAIAKAILSQDILVAEAGTGTGKTFAYLVPCLLSGKKTLISTATKTLQDQLFYKDLPMLVRALGLSARVQNLKGRSNYICRYRTELHAEEGQFASQQSVTDILVIREKMSQLSEGLRSELPEIKEDSFVWPFVTSTSDNCLGSECPAYQKCFLVKARKKALEADVVVINHHLFFADSRLKEEGFGELLPGVDVVIFDEAHQLAEIATNFYGERLGTKQIQDLMKDVLKEWPILDLANQPLKRLSLQLDNLIDDLLRSLPGHEERISWERVAPLSEFKASIEQLQQLITNWLACFSTVEQTEEPGLMRCKERLLEFNQRLASFDHPKQRDIRWIERFKHALVFNATPYDIAEPFSALLKKQSSCWVFTSATLTMASSFDCFTRPLGLQEIKTLKLQSPFDFAEQALLYLPRGLPDPKDHRYYELLLEKALTIINACKGRCFFLFTSHKALNEVASLLKPLLTYPLLIQGDEAKSILLARFREYGNAVLLGTATFWEGVDVKGEALSCVIIDKLPFASPTDPIMRGKMAYLKSQGLSAFDVLSLPSAILALKQGVGRLIRDAADRGVLMIADPRLTGRDYGSKIFASLPNMRKTRDETNVIEFIKTLG
ncbi:ATP-dependent DNA helicase [Legionella impletisoli]|uniref:ATP-dependent DNA helicase n=1 Tax=Legionella impletisoli TaxID=343510 RepID=UPI001041B2FD|nr:ATP-dependent DNA helicase [Legionella impletisoli]